MKFSFMHIFGDTVNNAKLAISWPAWKATLTSKWSLL